MLRAFLTSASVEDFQKLYLQRQEKLKHRIKAQYVQYLQSLFGQVELTVFFDKFWQDFACRLGLCGAAYRSLVSCPCYNNRIHNMSTFYCELDGVGTAECTSF
jgi:galactose-1-phosphate uridylyltransferase